MSSTTMVFLIVAFGIVGGVIKSYIDKRFSSQANAALNGKERARLDDLEARVKTLERIVTDKSNRLSDEIDSL